MANPQPFDTPLAVRLRDAHELAVSTVRARILAVIEAQWNASANLRDEDVARLVNKIAPLVETGQLAIARLTSVYLAQQATMLRGVTVRPAPIAEGIANIRGVPSTEVYKRPANTVYTALFNGYNFEDAKGQGLARLMKMAATDMQLAKTTQANASLKHSGAQLYRRTLTGKENCSICSLAAKHTYKTGDLAPIHDDCDCGVEEMPATGTRSAIFDDVVEFATAHAADSTVRSEQVVDGGKAIRTADGDTREPDFSDLAVSENSETGPTLHWAQHGFTTAADLPGN